MAQFIGGPGGGPIGAGPIGYGPTVLDASDTTPPSTTITSKPIGAQFQVGGPSSVGGAPDAIGGGSILVSTASFVWTGLDDVTATGNLVYAYRLDPIEPSFSAFGAAVSKVYTGLANGNYRFYVKARDEAGNEDLTPDTWAFTVDAPIPDTTPPDTTITSGPTGTIGVTTAAFAWTGTDNITPVGSLVYAYRLHPLEPTFSAFGAAVSKSYTGLPSGSYTFYVVARDAAGNTDPTPASRAFAVSVADVTAPITAITSGPSGTIAVSSVTFTWSGSDDVTPVGSLVYAYRLDPLEAAFSAFSGTTTRTYTGLADGTYTFYVKAKDQAGNEDATPDSRSFTVALVPFDGDLLPAVRQDTWQPVWVFDCSAFPARYATRDIDVFGAPGVPFGGGDVGVGGGPALDYLRGEGRFSGQNPGITRRIMDPTSGIIEVEDITMTFSNVDGALSGDYRGAVGVLSLYDVESKTLNARWIGVVTFGSRSRGTYTIQGSNAELAALRDEIPKGVITLEDYPLAVDVGKTPQWVFGNHVNLPLLYVRDGQADSTFDYLVQRGTAAAIKAMRRVTPSGTAPFVEIGYVELEPYPGRRVLLNGSMESWPVDPSGGPDSWSFYGAGATIAKNTTTVADGSASAALTSAAAGAYLAQNLVVNLPDLPISWWRGRTVALSVRVWSDLAGSAFVAINDGAQVVSDYHSGSGLFETLGCALTVDPTATFVIVVCGVVGLNDTACFDQVQVDLIATSWNDGVLRTDLYPGRSAVRFHDRQDDTAGSLYGIVADVNGLQAERNAGRALRTMFSDAPNGLGKTADAASFDQAEIDAAVDYLGLYLLLAPQLLLAFDEPSALAPARDTSGHERHGVYVPVGATAILDAPGASDQDDDGALYIPNNANHVAVPNSMAFNSDTAVGMSMWYFPEAGGARVSMARHPIAERTDGDVALSGYGFDQNAGQIEFFVNASGGLVDAHVALTDDDQNQWLFLTGAASDGLLTLTVTNQDDGIERTGTGAYVGALPTGSGQVFVGKYGSGRAEVNTCRQDIVAIYTDILPTSAQFRALFEGRHLGPGTETALSLSYFSTIQNLHGGGVFSPPTLFYSLDEPMGSGLYTGNPHLGVPGLISQRRGPLNGETAVSWENNIAQYRRVTTPSLSSGTALSILCLYRPDAQSSYSGLVEKTVGGENGVNTGWLLFQEAEQIVWRVKVPAGLVGTTFPVTREDIGRQMMLGATYDNGTLTLYRNGVVAGAASYTGPVATGSGDLFMGCLGFSGGSLIYPAQGDQQYVAIWNGEVLTAAEMMRAFIAATWYNGGLLVDLAMTESRQAQDWIREVTQLRSIGFGLSATGAITCTVDAAPPTTVRLHARDGIGDGERTIKDIRERARPRLGDAIRDLILKYRIDHLSGEYLRESRWRVSSRLDAQGQRIGHDLTVKLDGVREDTTADRVGCYMAARLALDETVQATLGQVALNLRERELVLTTDALMGYDGAVLEAQNVRTSLEEVNTELREYDADRIYTYRPQAFPVGAGPG